jgi:hypothetical protein
MRTNVVVAALAAAFLSSVAHAAVSFTSSPGAPDLGPASGETIVVDFDTPAAAGYSWSGGLAVKLGTLAGNWATPALDTTQYGVVSSAFSPNTATLTTPGLKSISFYWGSVDDYNSLDVLDSVGNVLLTITGSHLPVQGGDQFIPSTNRRVFIAWDGNGAAIGGLKFTSTGVAFEFDDFAAAGVPEPATWGMMILGFGMVGLAARRRSGLVRTLA